MKPKLGRFSGLNSARRAALWLAVPFVFAAAPAGAQQGVAEGGIVIKDFVLTHAIAQREPIDLVDGFTPHDERGTAFFRIFNDGQPTDLRAIWTHEGNVHANVELTIGNSPGWRTWSSVNLKPGQWNVQLRDPRGVVLAERSFAVQSEFAEGSSADMGADVAPAGAGFDDEVRQQVEDWPELEGTASPDSGDWDG